MADTILRCHACGAREEVPRLRGTWWATCGHCGQVHRIVGPAPESGILRCPRCAYAEEVAPPLAEVLATCPACGHRWPISR